jgi:hypothetical protein
MPLGDASLAMSRVAIDTATRPASMHLLQLTAAAILMLAIAPFAGAAGFRLLTKACARCDARIWIRAAGSVLASFSFSERSVRPSSLIDERLGYCEGRSTQRAVSNKLPRAAT